MSTWKFTDAEISFLRENEICRVATSYNDNPYVTPVTYIYTNSFFYFATDYTTKKYRNLKKNGKVVLEIDDTYKSSLNNRAIVIRGEVAMFIEEGWIFRMIYDTFYQKFEWVKKDPFKEKEAPFVAVRPLRKVSWGLQ